MLARRCSRAALIVLTALAASCGLFTEPQEPRQLFYEVSAPQLLLTNATNQRTFYMVVEANLLVLINWAACADPFVCPSLPPGGHVSLDFEQIPGYSPTTEHVVLYWWHSKGAVDGVQSPDRVRSTVIPLR